MDVFPTNRSSRLVSIANLGKWAAFEAFMLQGLIFAFIPYLDPRTRRIFIKKVENWTGNKKYVDNFKRTVAECQKVSFFVPDIKWDKVVKKLEICPTNKKKNSDQRMNFKIGNIILCKQLFSFGYRTVPAGEGHVYQTSDAPMLIYELTDKGLLLKPTPSMIRRSFVEHDQSSYDRYVLHPNSTYVVPPETRYLILTVQKTLFAVDLMDWEEVKHLQDFRTHRSYIMSVYNLPPPTPMHPSMVMPEERRAKKARIESAVFGRLSPQQSSPVVVFNPPSPQQSPPVVFDFPSPQQSPPAVFDSPSPQQSAAELYDPELPVPQQSSEDVRLFDPSDIPLSRPLLQQSSEAAELYDTPVSQQSSVLETSQDDMDFLERDDICPDTLNQFLTEFKQELGDQIYFDIPPDPEPTNVLYGERILTRLPKQTYELGNFNTSSNVLPPFPSDSPPWISDTNVDALSGEPMDMTLATHDRVMLPSKTHVFDVGQYPLNLCIANYV